MNTIKQWLADHNFSSHTIVAAMTAAFGLYIGNSQVKTIVDEVLAAHPKWSSAFGLAMAIYLKYSGSHSDQGVQKLAAEADTNALKDSAQKAQQ